MTYPKTYLCLLSPGWCRFHLEMQYWASCRRAGRQRTCRGIFLQSSRTWTLISCWGSEKWEYSSLSLTTCVRCLSKIGIGKLTTLLQACIHFIISPHRDIYWTGQIYVINILEIMKHKVTSKVKMEFPPPQKCVPFCRLCTRAVWMYTILSTMWR